MFKCFLGVVYLIHCTQARGILLLYRPKDISNDCMFSQNLRYDLSFGNGLSDTITLVFRTLNEIDYECSVEIVTDVENRSISLLVVIRYPNNIGLNCEANADAFTVMKKKSCLRLCDLIGHRDTNSPYYIISVRGRIRFRFLSNSSINTDMNANMYQVTATSARKKPLKGCDLRNESACATADDEYCFTSGVVCDGIKNCGVSDWFDERKSECGMPVERISYAPLIAVVAVMLCLTLGACHLLVRYLPPLANSFFIFNANEDNRLCIDPVFTAPDYTPYDVDKAKRVSAIPVSSSSSDDIMIEDSTSEAEEPEPEQAELKEEVAFEEINAGDLHGSDLSEVKSTPRRKITMRAMTELVQRRFRAVSRRRSSSTSPQPQKHGQHRIPNVKS